MNTHNILFSLVGSDSAHHITSREKPLSVSYIISQCVGVPVEITNFSEVSLHVTHIWGPDLTLTAP